MVKAIVDIEEHSNQILNIVKAKYNLRNKSEAINMMAEIFEEEILEPELRPEYIEKALKIHSQPSLKVNSIDNLRKRVEGDVWSSY